MATRSKHVPQDAADAFHGSDNRERGIRKLKPRLGRPKPYGVQWSEREWDEARGREVRRVKNMYFATEAQRDGKFAALRKARREGALRSLTRAEADAWRAFKALIGDTPWQQVVAAWQRSETAAGRGAAAVKIADQVATYVAELQAQAARRELSRGTVSQRKGKLTLFAADFGERLIGDITSADIERWLALHGLNEAGTYNNWLKIVRGFFEDAVRRRLVAENPCARVANRRLRAKPSRILTVPQLAQLFHTAATLTDASGVRPFFCTLRRLALEAFAGVRFSSANRLTTADINIEDRGICHPAESIKTGRRHYVSGYPDVLWEWLAIAPQEDALTERQYLQLKSRLFDVAHVPHPRNCLRHSFATYHLAVRKNPGETAMLLCHTNQAKLWNTYKGNATAAEGKRWEALTPPAVQTVAAEWTATLRPAGTPAPAPGDPPPRETTR